VSPSTFAYVSFNHSGAAVEEHDDEEWGEEEDDEGGLSLEDHAQMVREPSSTAALSLVPWFFVSHVCACACACVCVCACAVSSLQVLAILKPVAVTMLLVIWVVKTITIPYNQNFS